MNQIPGIESELLKLRTKKYGWFSAPESERPVDTATINALDTKLKFLQRQAEAINKRPIPGLAFDSSGKWFGPGQDQSAAPQSQPVSKIFAPPEPARNMVQFNPFSLSSAVTASSSPSPKTREAWSRMIQAIKSGTTTIQNANAALLRNGLAPIPANLMAQ